MARRDPGRRRDGARRLLHQSGYAVAGSAARLPSQHAVAAAGSPTGSDRIHHRRYAGDPGTQSGRFGLAVGVCQRARGRATATSPKGRSGAARAAGHYAGTGGQPALAGGGGPGRSGVAQGAGVLDQQRLRAEARRPHHRDHGDRLGGKSRRHPAGWHSRRVEAVSGHPLFGAHPRPVSDPAGAGRRRRRDRGVFEPFGRRGSGGRWRQRQRDQYLCLAAAALRPGTGGRNAQAVVGLSGGVGEARRDPAGPDRCGVRPARPAERTGR